MTNRTVALSLVVLASFATLQGCRRKAEPAPTPAAPAVDANSAAQRRADSLAALDAQRRADSVAAANAAAARDAAARETQVEMNNLLAQKVYFDFDSDQLRDDAVSTLDQKAAVLQANPSVTLVVTGHTDERGTAEYNLALGQRRAAQVKRYLVGKGLSDARLTTQSLGDSQPVAAGSDEAAYQQNRRAEFQARGVNGALVRPRG